jgi:inosine-uridine nucleoside N-ribohydrolase
MALPLILDTDIGDDVDDAFAILLAALEPALSLVAVTTVYGDAPHRARIARKLLDLAGRPDVPVAVGHGNTLTGHDPLASQAPGTEMSSGRGFVAPPGSVEWNALGARLHPEPAVDLIIRTVSEAAEPPVVAAIGPLTNLAAALRRAPEMARRARAVALMGGRLGAEAALGEHNFNSDPEATRIVLESGARLLIGTYEVTMQARIGIAELPRLRAGTPACRATADQLERYLTARNRTATSMYDPLSLTLAYTDRYLSTMPVALATTIADRRVHLRLAAGAPPTAHVTTALDAPAFVDYLLATIGA